MKSRKSPASFRKETCEDGNMGEEGPLVSCVFSPGRRPRAMIPEGAFFHPAAPSVDLDTVDLGFRYFAALPLDFVDQ